MVPIVLVLSKAELVFGLANTSFRRIHDCFACIAWFRSITITSTSTKDITMELSYSASPPAMPGVFSGNKNYYQSVGGSGSAVAGPVANQVLWAVRGEGYL